MVGDSGGLTVLSGPSWPNPRVKIPSFELDFQQLQRWCDGAFHYQRLVFESMDFFN